MPWTPRDSKTMSHTALRCRCRPSGPGGTCWVQAGSGCLAARVTRSRGGGVGVGLAQLVAGPHGHHHLARHMPRGSAGLASGASRTSIAPRALTGHTVLRLAAVHHRCLRACRHRGLRGARRAPRAIGAGACTCAWRGAEYPAPTR